MSELTATEAAMKSVDFVFDHLFRPQHGFNAEAERAKDRSRELAIADRAADSAAARTSDDSVRDAIYSGFFDIPNAQLADLFRAGDQAELGRLIFEAADKVLRENADA
jgi:hypothetical protein